MLGFTEFLLANEVEPEKQRGILETIYHETERLNELIGNFLDMQRLKSETGSLSTEVISVADIINNSARLFSCEKDMHQISVDCQPDLPNIRGDGEKLHQVMINLLSNACKYSPSGSQVTITARNTAGEIIVTVADEGIGIPPDLRQKVFERFYRVDNSDRRMVGGTGLGLSLVKDIIDAHSGRVWIEANSPTGSRFMFAIPTA
jgi:signal transduction histidine kinase